MGKCYICGKKNVNYKRTVHTGDSYRTTISSKGRVYASSSEHYGQRIVCAKCALDLDYKDKCHNGHIFGIIVFSIFFFLSFKPICEEQIPLSIILNGIGIAFWILIYCINRMIAEVWYDKNEGRYFDKIDRVIENQILIEKERILALNKQMQLAQPAINQIEQIFAENFQQEMDLLKNKYTVFTKKYNPISIHAEEDANKLIKELDKTEKDINSTMKRVNKLCKDLELQYKNIIPDKAYIKNKMMSVEASKAGIVTAIQAFISEIKTVQNQVYHIMLSFNK